MHILGLSVLPGAETGSSQFQCLPEPTRESLSQKQKLEEGWSYSSVLSLFPGMHIALD